MSIMSSPFPEMILETGSPADTPVEYSHAIAIDRPKLKGRAKLLSGLQRISSSPSLAQFARKRASSNPYSGRTALSCVSLANSSSPRNHDDSYNTQSSAAGYSTAPTSINNTPGFDGPWFADGLLPVRRIEQHTFLPGASTPTSAVPLVARSRGNMTPERYEDYFSLPIAAPKPARKVKVDYWGQMPHEMKLSILAFLTPKQLVQASRISPAFHRLCFDGQLWTSFDASEFYKDIPAESLAKIIVAAGPFVKNLNLRGCVQVEHYKRADVVVTACRNLIDATLEGCKNFQRPTLHNLLKSNERLSHLNLTGLTAVTNGTCKIIAESCPMLQMFNVSWCTHMDGKGIHTIILGCPKLKDLRAGEVQGFGNMDLAQSIFETNQLERLVLSGCIDLTDEAFRTMLTGRDPEVDILTGLAVVPVRKLRHLDLARCSLLTSSGVKTMAHLVPCLEGLQLGGCTTLTDAALEDVLITTPRLTHLDLEELPELSNLLLSESLAKSPCATILEHLSISYCEKLGDLGMIPVIRACTNLRYVDLDNTKISDLLLTEAAAMVRARSARTTSRRARPRISLQMVVFDCVNVTWTGIREVLSRNSEVREPNGSDDGATYPTETIGMKCFYGWQMTVDEHHKRIMRGDLPAAGRLVRKWTEWMMANEEAAANGGGLRRRRRRAREAQMMHADEEEGGAGMGGIGRRRRRARSNGCQIM